MNYTIIYGIIFVILLIFEVAYFKIANKYNIIDKPNERSSHSIVVLRGGGIIFLIGVWVWSAFWGYTYPWFLASVTVAAGVSFVDDIRSLPDSLRLVAQFFAMGLMFYQLGMLHWGMWWMVILALIVCVGATNVINFMDGVNGITAGYSLSVMCSLLLVNFQMEFMESSFIIVVILSLIVFSIFNFRPKGKATCFSGDVGSIGIGFIMMFALGKLVLVSQDITWLILLVVYGIDGVLTICHRIMLHENLGEAHRKHAYQLMANELRMGHVTVSCIYLSLQLMISLGFIYACPADVLSHWMYLIGSIIVLGVAYVLFKRKYYHLHEAYLANLKK